MHTMSHTRVAPSRALLSRQLASSVHSSCSRSCLPIFTLLGVRRCVCRGVCCQFDFPRMSSSHPYKGCPWGVNPQPITPANVAERSAKLLDQYRKKASLYRTRHVLAPIGNDFEFMRTEYAENQFKNYQAIFDHMNSDPKMNVHARFATLHEYFHDVTKFVQEHPAEPATTAVPGNYPNKRSPFHVGLRLSCCVHRSIVGRCTLAVSQW
jgi:hypothetical protein